MDIISLVSDSVTMDMNLRVSPAGRLVRIYHGEALAHRAYT
jgi:hypothetical protein